MILTTNNRPLLEPPLPLLCVPPHTTPFRLMISLSSVCRRAEPTNSTLATFLSCFPDQLRITKFLINDCQKTLFYWVWFLFYVVWQVRYNTECPRKSRKFPSRKVPGPSGNHTHHSQHALAEFPYAHAWVILTPMHMINYSDYQLSIPISQHPSIWSTWFYFPIRFGFINHTAGRQCLPNIPGVRTKRCIA